MVTKSGALGRMRFIFRVPRGPKARVAPNVYLPGATKSFHFLNTFSLVSQSSSHDLSHETALEQFLLLIFEYTNSPAGISHFGEHIGFEHCNNRNRLRLCMCTIHGGRGPADRLRRGFDDSMVGGVCRFILAVTPRWDT